MPGPLPKYPIDLSSQQQASLLHLSSSYTAPFAEVLRARILLLAHHHPHLSNAEIARRLACSVSTVKLWRKRWQSCDSLKDLARSGSPRTFTSLQRAQIISLACSSPQQHSKPWMRWSGEKLAEVAVEQQIVESISPSTIRTWLREDKIKPWRYHSWQHSQDPQFVEKASAVLDLYEQAEDLQGQGEMVVGVDEKTSIQARQRVSKTQAAGPGEVMKVADRYKRMGALQLFCALVVATGVSYARTRARKKFADFKAFLEEFFRSRLCEGLKVLHLILDNGPTHAPKQLSGWISEMELSFEVRIYWLPKYASWLDQVEIIFSKVQRDVLTPNDFGSLMMLDKRLMSYFDEINKEPKPIRWSYTKRKMMMKFGAPQSAQLVA